MRKTMIEQLVKYMSRLLGCVFFHPGTTIRGSRTFLNYFFLLTSDTDLTQDSSYLCYGRLWYACVARVQSLCLLVALIFEHKVLGKSRVSSYISYICYKIECHVLDTKWICFHIGKLRSFLAQKKGDSIKGLMAVEFFPLINCLVMKKYQHTAFKNSQVSPFCYKMGYHVFNIEWNFFQIRKRGNFVNTKRGRQYQMFDGCRILSFLFLFI